MEVASVVQGRAIAVPTPDEAGRTLLDRVRRRRKADKNMAVVTPQDTRTLSAAISLFGKPLGEVMADVEHFSSLIDDRQITMPQLGVELDEKQRVWFTCELVRGTSVAEKLRCWPTATFLASLARYVNANTSLRGLTGAFLTSLVADAPSRPAAHHLLTHLLKQLSEAFHRKDRSTNMLRHKPIMLRTLEADSTGKWPSYRSARALLHAEYRDDISHSWMATNLARLAPSAVVTRYRFNGDLLLGALLLPDICRTESDSEYGGGLMFFSGEVGNRRAGVQPFVYRAVTRSVVLAGRVWGVTHSGRVELTKLQRSIDQYVHEQIPLVSTLVDRMLSAKNIVLNADHAVNYLTTLRSHFPLLTKQDMKGWRAALEVEREQFSALDFSVLTLQNALTRFSGDLEDPVRQTQIDQAAGRLVDLDWEAVKLRASTVSSTDMADLFGREV